MNLSSIKATMASIKMHLVYLLMITINLLIAITHGRLCEGMGSEILDRFERIGDSYYIVDATAKVNWYTAVQSCRRHGANLLSIESQSELDALSNVLLERNYQEGGESVDRFWVSGNDLEERGKYVWLRTGEPMLMDKYWSISEPSSPGYEDCIEIWYKKDKFELNDVPCSELMGFLCEVDEYTQRRQNMAEFIYKTLLGYAKCEK